MDEARGQPPETVFRTEREPRLKLLIPMVVACATLMEALDQTIVLTALPQMAASLGESALRLNLSITSYLLSLAVFIPVSGWAADRFGARTVFCWAVAIFTIGSALCGAATSLTMLVLTRILQGLGGALMSPVGRLVMLRSFPKSDLVVAMGYVMIPAMVGPALGPLVGGFLTTYVSWRWIFYINVPLGILGILLALRWFENFRGAFVARFDLGGFLLCGIGLAALELALELLGRSRAASTTAVPILVLALLGLGAYLFYATRTPDPVLDLRLFRIKTFRLSQVGGTVCRTGYMSTSFLMPLLLQLPLGLDAFHSGLTTSVMSIGSIAMRTLTPAILRRFGFRPVLLWNGITVMVLMGALALITEHTPLWAIALGLFILGFFRSIQYTCIGSLGFADLGGPAMSTGSTLSSVAQQLSSSFGVAIAAMLLAVIAGPGHVPSVADFRPVFLIMVLFPLVSNLWFLRLSASDGAQMSGHRDSTGA